MKKTAFTLIELIVVIAIIAILAAIVAPAAFKSMEKSKISRAMSDAKALRVASESYYADIGFWPPDVNRGADPGFMEVVPYNREPGNPGVGVVATGLPANWQNVANASWDGPYLERWPAMTPWGGKYDWNYWPTGAVRYGVTIPPGCYVGIQRDYSDQNPIPASSERMMVNMSFDGDGAANGEVQLLMKLL